jgi:hypothetical protein
LETARGLLTHRLQKKLQALEQIAIRVSKTHAHNEDMRSITTLMATLITASMTSTQTTDRRPILEELEMQTLQPRRSTCRAAMLLARLA